MTFKAGIPKVHSATPRAGNIAMTTFHISFETSDRLWMWGAPVTMSCMLILLFYRFSSLRISVFPMRI